MLAAGFQDPVAASQQTFRAMLASLARPGTLTTVPTPLGVPASLAPASAAIALTLFDFETTVWLGESLSARGDVADFIRFQTGTRLGCFTGEVCLRRLHRGVVMLKTCLRHDVVMLWITAEISAYRFRWRRPSRRNHQRQPPRPSAPCAAAPASQS